LDSATRELIHSYLAKARDKARVARELSDRGDWDDAVSRAYYAAFHAAQAALLTEGQRAETHRGLVVLFALLLVKTGKLDRRWGKFLANLKDDREAGDYDPLSYVDEETARRAVAEAEEFVAAVARYLDAIHG
jgi:hypothetical protein